jgi:hypothetical protein
MHDGSEASGAALRAAIGRRDRGEAPELWDSRLLHRAREKPNPRPPHEPVLPGPGSARKLLDLLRSRGNRVSIEDAVAHLGIADEKQVRNLIDSLRKLHWWIDNSRPRHFQLFRIAWPATWECVRVVRAA